MHRRSTGHTIDGAKNGGQRRAAGKLKPDVINMDDVRDQGRPRDSDKPGNSVFRKVDDYPPLANTLYIIGSVPTPHHSLARQSDDPRRLGSARVLPGDQHQNQQRCGCNPPPLQG